MNVKLAIVGSRTFTDYAKLHKTVTQILKVEQIEHIISGGGAYGTDSLAERFAKQHKIELTVYTPDWERLGKSAGMIRNKTIIDSCDCAIAFWDGISKGTKNAIEYCKKTDTPLVVISTIV